MMMYTNNAAELYVGLEIVIKGCTFFVRITMNRSKSQANHSLLPVKHKALGDVDINSNARWQLWGLHSLLFSDDVPAWVPRGGL